MIVRAPCRAAVLLALGCGGDPAPPADVAGGPRTALAEDRRALADPERHPLRQGLRVDEEALRRVLLRLRSHHGAQVAVAYEASLAGLPAMPSPAAPDFTEVAAFELPGDAAARDAEAINWLFDTDVRQTASRVLATYLTLVMHQDLGLQTREIGVWMAFLRAAEPTVARCGGTGDGGPWVCLDYGSDVFVLELARQDPGWIARKLRWMQRPAAPDDAL